MFKRIRRLLNFLGGYVSDSSVDIKSRTFVLFSVAMLGAMYLAIPAGLIMGGTIICYNFNNRWSCSVYNIRCPCI